MDKNIFPYHDGERNRFGDPLAIYRSLVRGCAGDLAGWMQRRNADNQVAAADAWDRLLAAVRDAFKMKPFAPEDGSGATDEQCDETLNAFLDWIEKKKSSTAG